MAVNTPSKNYNQWLSEVRLCKALMGGTTAMLAGSTGANPLTDFLPKEEGESDEKYRIRKARSKLLNIFRRTVSKITGAVFAKPVVIDDAIDADIADWLTDIDMDGENITRFVSRIFKSALTDGSAHILIDFPKADGIVTKADETQSGVRPYWIPIRTENIIGFKQGTANGKKTLTQVRIREWTEKETDYDVEYVEQIRVLEPGTYQIFRKDGDDWKSVESGNTSLGFIPLVTWQAGEAIDRIYAKPPLNDLAELNLLHFQSSSDQRNILHAIRIPILFGKNIRQISAESGEDDGTVVVGSGTMIHSSDSDADLRYVEHSGAGIDAGRQDLEDLKSEMALFGLSLILPQTGDVTATQRALDAAENDSQAKQWAESFEDAIDLALDYTAAWVGKENESGCNINADFSLFMTETSAQILIEAYAAGIMPLEIVAHEFKRRGLIQDTWDIADIKAMLDDDKRRQLI